MESNRADRWLSLCLHAGDGSLLNSGRLGMLLDGLPDPENQFPSLIASLGNSCSSNPIYNIFREPVDEARNPHISLVLDNSTRHMETPILFTTCTLASSMPQESAPEYNHNTLEWFQTALSVEETVDIIYRNLILPFTDVLCMFSNCHGRSIDNANKSVQWLDYIGKSLSSAASLRVIFIFKDIINSRSVSFRHRAQCIKGILGSRMKWVTLICLPDLHISSPAVVETSMQRFRALLHQQSYTAQMIRERESRRLNSPHFTFLFQLACEHVSKTPEYFDLIHASRIGRPVLPALKQHIEHLLYHMTDEGEVVLLSAPIIASALMMDSCPPGIHRFSGQDIFNCLYRSDVAAAFHNFSGSESSSRPKRKVACETDSCLLKFIAAIEHLLDNNIRQLKTRYLSASTLHKKTLARFKSKWTTIKSYASCFFCLLRMPEHVLHPGHALCSECVRLVGTCVANDPHRFVITKCPFCQLTMVSGPRTIAVEPPTTGPRIMTLDGGGVRGILELEMLQILEEKLQFPICTAVDLIIGTSTGGLIALGLGVNGWSVGRCADEFERLITQAFHRHRIGNLPLVGPLFSLFLSYFKDSFYDSSRFEVALKSTFGNDQELFGKGRDSGMKVGVIATTSNAFPCILSNYNGANIPSVDCGYVHLRGNIMVHEAARSTSAAPFYHTTITLSNIKTSSDDCEQTLTLQDGGVCGMNNPTSIALQESQVLYPTAQKPDLLISLGSGHSKSNQTVTTGKQCSGWMQRIRWAFLRSLDCQKIWQEHLNYLLNRQQDSFHRLAVEFDHDPPFDDVGSLNTLKVATRSKFIESQQLLDIVSSIEAKCFYFELSSPPILHEKGYMCTGSIHCRLYAGSPELYTLVSRLASYSAQFTIGNLPIAHINETTAAQVSTGHGFAMDVLFFARTLDETIAIHLRNDMRRQNTISSFPHSMSWFINQQQLNMPFSRIHHIITVDKKRKGQEIQSRYPKRARRTIRH